MNELFGIPMTNIMWVLVVLFAISLGSVLTIYFTNRTMFKMGLRNIPRRGAQTALVVVGLMLSTLIISAAFTTGDTIDYSITKTAYDQLGRTDLTLNLGGASVDGTRGYPDEKVISALQSRFASDPDIDSFVPRLAEIVPALNPRTRLAEPNVQIVGLDPAIQDRLGGLRLRDGGTAKVASLGPGQVYVNKTMANKFDAKTGDTITVYAQGQEYVLQVAGIVENELASGVNTDFGSGNNGGGMAAQLATVQRITGHAGRINAISVALKGEVRGSEKNSDPAAERLESFLKSDEGKAVIGMGGLEVTVDTVKKDAVEVAETFGNLFTTFFLVLGLFSIAAGILLIFMIFVMLAAERKTEMGMARAVGAKRNNLVQMFVSEGMSYNLMAGMVGAALGVGASFAIVVVGMKALLGDDGDFLSAHVTPRSLIISYCLGVVITFITVVISSMRVSRVNIVAAVRGTDDVKGREGRLANRSFWPVLGVIFVLFFPLLPLGLWMIVRKGYRERGTTRPVWLLLAVPASLVLQPLAIWLALRKGLSVRGESERFPFSMSIIGAIVLGGAFALTQAGASADPVNGSLIFTGLGVGLLGAVTYLFGIWLWVASGFEMADGAKSVICWTLTIMTFVVTLLVSPIIWLIYLLRKGFGLPWALVWGPIGLLFGALMMLVGKSSGQLFPFALGISLLPLSAAAIARHYGAPNRGTWTVVGALLLLYWLMPDTVLEKIFGTFKGNIEMFVLSGIMIVIGFTLVIVFNARLLTVLFHQSEGGSSYVLPGVLTLGAVVAGAGGYLLGNAGDGLGQLLYLVAALLLLTALLALAAARFAGLAPALKMGVAYPLANRFRTGMTIAMFSLIVFSIVVMSTMNANFAAIFAGDDARGGWDVVAESNRTNPVTDLAGDLRAAGGFDTGKLAVAARASALDGTQEVRQTGKLQSNGQPVKWERYPVRAGDDTFFAKNEAVLDIRARGYASDRDAFEAVRTTPGLAIMDYQPVPSGNFGDTSWKVSGIKAGDTTMEPLKVDVHDPVTGQATTLTVIGVLSQKIPFGVMPGIYTNEQTFAPVFGAPDYRVHFLRLTGGTDAERAAKDIKAALLTKGVQAFSMQERIDTQQRQNIGFTRLFQAFMALGLLVGIAALGVIAFRAVVERRQQIGMLRAIGYQRGTVALTFLLESSFVAMMGILSGVIGAAILSRNLMTSESFRGTSATDFEFFIPWGEVIAFVVVAYVFSLLLTWWPSRGASRVPIADALRYE